MAIPLHFLTIVARHADITRYYPGGLPAFRATYQPLEDPDLVALCRMSGGDLEETFAELAPHGLAVGRQLAVGDMWAGPLDPAPGIDFANQPGAGVLPVWVALCRDAEATHGA